VSGPVDPNEKLGATPTMAGLRKEDACSRNAEKQGEGCRLRCSRHTCAVSCVSLSLFQKGSEF